MLIITNQTKIPKGYKLPRKRKKEFKKYWIGLKSSITLDGSKVNQTKEAITKLAISWVNLTYKHWMLHKYNLKDYKGLRIVKVY